MNMLEIVFLVIQVWSMKQVRNFVKDYRRSDHVRKVYDYVMLFPSGSDKFKLVMDRLPSKDKNEFLMCVIEGCRKRSCTVICGIRGVKVSPVYGWIVEIPDY